MLEIDVEIKKCIRQQAYLQEQTREELNKINSDAIVMIDKIESVKANASHSQSIVEGGCFEIKQLDNAKKNVDFAVNTLKELHKLVTGIEQLREFCIQKQYKSAGDLIKECGQLLGFFFKNHKMLQSTYGPSNYSHQEDFSDVEELKSLKEEWDHLCN